MTGILKNKAENTFCISCSKKDYCLMILKFQIHVPVSTRSQYISLSCEGKNLKTTKIDSHLRGFMRKDTLSIS